VLLDRNLEIGCSNCGGFAVLQANILDDPEGILEAQSGVGGHRVAL
jgi:hypothetical protein